MAISAKPSVKALSGSIVATLPRWRSAYNRLHHGGHGIGDAMRKAILMVLLAGVSSSAAAEWVAVGGGETSTAYAEPATIRRAGNTVKMWSLLDFEKARVSATHVYMSVKGQDEYDCKEERSRRLYFSRHSGNMGEGEVVYTNADSDRWEPVPPRSVIGALWKLACEKR